jgi:hypothetical protein
MNRRKRRGMQRLAGTMYSDMPVLGIGDVGLLRWIAACLHRMAREIEAVARRNKS